MGSGVFQGPAFARDSSPGMLSAARQLPGVSAQLLDKSGRLAEVRGPPPVVDEPDSITDQPPADLRLPAQGVEPCKAYC